MDIDSITKLASERRLTKEEVDQFCTQERISLETFYDRLAAFVAHGYADGSLTYSFCDAVMNNQVHEMLLNCSTCAEYFDAVFLAFDAGEYHHVGDPADADLESLYTRPQIAKIIAEAKTI